MPVQRVLSAISRVELVPGWRLTLISMGMASGSTTRSLPRP